jgi:CRP-like cAMP-binding protein
MKNKRKYTTQRKVSYEEDALRIETETAFIEQITFDELRQDAPKIAYKILHLISAEKVQDLADLKDYCIIALIKKVSDRVRVTILRQKIGELTNLKKHAVIKRLEKLRVMGIYVSKGTKGSGHRYPIFNEDLFTF